MDDLKRLTSKPYAELSLNERCAIRCHIIVLAEALEAYASNSNRRLQQCFPVLLAMLQSIGGKGICNCVKDLTAIVRLRSLLIHRYWVIDDSQV